MSNERNAGRKPKYGIKVPLRELRRKVPIDKFTEISKKVDAILETYKVKQNQTK